MQSKQNFLLACLRQDVKVIVLGLWVTQRNIIAVIVVVVVIAIEWRVFREPKV